MQLKSGDIILSVDHKQVSNQADFYKSLSSKLKKLKPFKVSLKRGKKRLFTHYQFIFYKKGQYKLKIVNKPPTRQIASTPNSSQTKKNSSKIKSSSQSKKAKNLVPERYKPYMQRAYISRSNSFVYSKPNFDAPQLQSLSIGKLVLISRKVFLPPHGFGSFYRVFLFRKKKLIGYISEAEVIPEFIKKEDSYLANPSYKKAKAYKNKKQILKIEEIEDTVYQNQQLKIQKEIQKRLSLKTNYKKYLGLSLGYSSYLNQANSPISENVFLGVKLSTYGSKINMDFNLDLHRYKGASSILIALPFIRSQTYSLFVMGGGLMEYIPYPSIPLTTSTFPIDYGPIGAVSLLTPISKNFILKLEAKGDYKVLKKQVSLNLLSSLQFAF